MRGLGTLVNVATVLAGAGLGVLLGDRVGERIRTTLLTGVGLAVLAVGVSSFLETRNAVFPVVSIVLGGLAGELLRIEERLEGAGEAIRSRVERAGPARQRTTFVEGFVTATLTFCVGALTVVGSLQDGVAGDADLLIVKSALDGIVAVVYAGVFGWGVAFSAGSILVLQGALTAVGAAAGEAFLTGRMTAELEATGGVMIVGIGLRLLDIRRVPVGSFLPGLAVAPLLVALFAV